MKAHLCKEKLALFGTKINDTSEETSEPEYEKSEHQKKCFDHPTETFFAAVLLN